MAFDGITTKVIADELQFLSGSRIDKIFQPNKNEIIIGLYLDGKNYALDISIDAINYRINLTTHSKPNPQTAPNFCMLLRKHLLGLKLRSVITSNLERLIVLEIEGFDEFQDVVSKKLIIELMGKHGNIILVDENNLIIDSLRHIKNDNNENRSLLPHIKYTFPTTDKNNFLDIHNFKEFKNHLPNDITFENISLSISNTYNGISKIFIENIIDNLNITKLNDDNLKKIYEYMNTIINYSNTDNLSFKLIKYETKNKTKEDYFLTTEDSNLQAFHLNFFVDDFYYKKETNDNFLSYRNTVLKLILETLKKYNTRLSNINSKLKECENMDVFKLYGELITANLYKIENKNLNKITLENYYDDNKLITIPLDNRYLPSINAKIFYKKYNKLKNTLEIVEKQKEETINELNYLESIVYELETSSTLEEVTQIFDEISENVIFKNTIPLQQKKSKLKKSKFTKNKEVTFNPIKYTFDDITVLVGRNNKENDYLTLKLALKNDIWFHVKSMSGSHVILKTSNKMINDEILYKCAKLAVEHSKAKNSSNVPVDFCLVKNVKKPNGAKPGMVIYNNNKTIYVK